MKGPRKRSFQTGGPHGDTSWAGGEVISSGSKQRGKWLSSETEIAIDGTSEEESNEVGDVWERDFSEWNCSRSRALDLQRLRFGE